MFSIFSLPSCDNLWFWISTLTIPAPISSFLFMECPHLRQRNPTLHCTRAHSGPLRLTGANTKTRLEHKNSFSKSPCHVIGILRTITLLIPSTSSCYYWATFSKDGQDHISTKLDNGLNCTALEGSEEDVEGPHLGVGMAIGIVTFSFRYLAFYTTKTYEYILWLRAEYSSLFPKDLSPSPLVWVRSHLRQDA